MFCTVLMAEVVGEVDASLFLSLMIVLGLEECLSLLQVGLLGISESQEQFGEQGGSYLHHIPLIIIIFSRQYLTPPSPRPD